jgi:membrane protease YdiL (CAAX protease family)
VFGIVAALIREWTGSTLNSFALHVTQNTFAVTVAYIALTH